MKVDKKDIFFPYYVNQGRLLDIYAIFNSGYSEYSEISTAVNKEGSVNGKVDATGGFKVFSFGISISGQNEKTDHNEYKEKKVQTVTSTLSIVKSTLEKNGYIKDILDAEVGDFVCLPVVLKINSIKSLMIELSDILKLAEKTQKLGAEFNNINKENLKSLNEMIKTIQVMFGGEEIIFVNDDYAIIGNVYDSNLYQATRADIIGSELKCLAQVKRKYLNGTQLLKNTIFAKIKNTEAKRKIIEYLWGMVNGNDFDFEATIVPSIEDKPVYQLEVIALYQ